MAVYGDMLGYFPELMATYTVFKMAPLPGGGFADRVPVKKVKAYFSNTLTGDAGAPDGLFEENDRARFFCASSLPKEIIRQGMYVEVYGDLYKFVHDATYVNEGGFIEYKLALVRGPTDQQVTDPSVPERIISDYAV